MTTHYYKTLNELTLEEVWEDAQRHLTWTQGKSYLPGAYVTLSEADNFAYDCWTYLNYLLHCKECNVSPRTPEQWVEHLDADTPERVIKKAHHIELLKGITDKFYSTQSNQGVGLN